LRSLRLILVTTLACFVSAAAFGAGFSIFEQGAKATGMAGAFAATADDPSAIFYNPAGLAQQRELTVLGGATFINFTNEFAGDPNSEFTSGVEGKYNRHTFVPPNVYATIPIGSNLTIGLGAFSAWGLRTDWQDPWAGRFISRDADLKTMSFEPAIAWQSSDGKIAIGGGIEYRRGRVILNANRGTLNPFNGRFVDVSNTRLESEYANDYAYNAGFLWKTDRFRFGASYRSDMDLEFKGKADFQQISTGNTQLDALVASQLPPDQTISGTVLPFPSVTAVGVAFKPTDNVEVEFDVTHMTWSRFKELTVHFDVTPAASFTRPQNWDDSSCYRLGANIKATNVWDVRLGALYDKNPQPTEAVGPLLPDSDRIGATFGVGFHSGPFIVDAAAFILHFKDRSTNGVNADGFNGTYQTDATLWSFNVGYRF
jgi:long-chain fatty acid transport protein